MNAVLWQLPRTHKGFHCNYDHDAVVRAFRVAKRRLDDGAVFKPCRCKFCEGHSND
jgi:hypothetical protein